MVELKAVENIAPIHLAQVLSYLKASKLRLGLLIRFNVRVLRTGIKRVIHRLQPSDLGGLGGLGGSLS